MPHNRWSDLIDDFERWIIEALSANSQRLEHFEQIWQAEECSQSAFNCWQSSVDSLLNQLSGLAETSEQRVAPIVNEMANEEKSLQQWLCRASEIKQELAAFLEGLEKVPLVQN